MLVVIFDEYELCLFLFRKLIDSVFDAKNTYFLLQNFLHNTQLFDFI